MVCRLQGIPVDQPFWELVAIRHWTLAALKGGEAKFRYMGEGRWILVVEEDMFRKSEREDECRLEFSHDIPIE